jgi:phage baseplate assembly protein W
MAGLSPKLPLTLDDSDGYSLTKTYPEMVRQNLKNLILTVPGERIMDPLFGIGLKKYLFEQHDTSTYSKIFSVLVNQTQKYMPFIRIDDVHFYGPAGMWSPRGGATHTAAPDADPNTMQMRIFFTIVPLASQTTLDLDAQV